MSWRTKNWHKTTNTIRKFVFMIAVAAFALQTISLTSLAQGLLQDTDAREGSVAPNSTQLEAVSQLGASASWNKFGTPSSLIRYGDFLATGISGADAESAARSWIDYNKALFRLSSVNGLKMMSDEAFPHSEVYAVTFRQEIGGLRSAEDGLLTVGVVGNSTDGWKIGYVSATTTGDTNLSGTKVLSAGGAFIKAAANIGHTIYAGDILNSKADGEWTTFRVNGFTNMQRARLRALPTPVNGVRQVFETVYLQNQGGLAKAYIHYIDAEDGRVWMRKDIVEQSHPTAAVFSGTMPGADGACVDNGPWTVEPGESVGTVAAWVTADLPANDSVIHILRDGAVVASQDTGTSPEAVAYSPTDDGVGEYKVQVCDYVDGAGWSINNDFSGTITFTEAGAGDAPSIYPPKWNIFPANPELGTEGSPRPTSETRRLWCWESDDPQACDEVANLFSRVPWDYDVRTNAPTFTTRGNNNIASEAWVSPLTPGGTAHQPKALDRNYDFSWTNQWSNSGCSPVFVPGQSQDISTAVTNLFAMHNRMHDWSYGLGFTERRWNAQSSNFGNNSAGTLENDPVIGNAQAGAASGGFPGYLGRDNANMITLPDGISPITNMYLWQPIAGAFYAPCADGDYDMAVIGHEFGHMTENRMIGKGDGRSGHHAGAMGESFGDFSGAEYLNEYGFAGGDGEHPFSVGAYATGNHERGIRNYNMGYARTGAFPEPGSSTTGSGIDGNTKVNPLNFSNHGYDMTGAQVHADGEIWSATNFDVRQILVEKYNASFPESNSALQKECADGQRNPVNCPGNRRWMQIVFDAMLLMPTAPSMLEARDAYLAADQMRFGGANQAEIWLAFARRGFGKNAASSNGPSNDFDTDPKPDFQALSADNAVITFNTIGMDESNVAVPARIFVGHYEARVSPVADTKPNTGPADGSVAPGSSNLDNVAGFAPGTYEFVAQAEGYGHVRFTQTFTAGQTKTVTIKMPTNRASVSKGATANGDGENFQHLIDDTEATNWDEPSGGAAINIQQPQVTVNLEGDAPVTINRVQVSAMLFSQNRFTALREFKVQTSTNGLVFTDWITSSADAFPGYNPRPVAPELILRSFEGEERQATHVRIIALNNQCTGNTDFQGVHDNDPLNVTDCRFDTSTADDPVIILGEVALVARHDEVHIAELQVFSSKGGTDNGGGGGGGENDCADDVDSDYHDCRVKGDGKFDDGQSEEAKFTIETKQKYGVVNGKLYFDTEDPDRKVRGTPNAQTINGFNAEVKGTCEYEYEEEDGDKIPCTFKVNVVDTNGGPGPDYFFIEIKDLSGNVLYSGGGNLYYGKIEVTDDD